MRDQKQSHRLWTTWWFDLLLLLVIWFFLLRIQNPGLMADDSGEITAAAVGLGIPHPPGYPLATLLGHIATWVPVGTPAFRLNLLSSAYILFTLWIGFFLLDFFFEKSGKGNAALRDRVFLILSLFSIHSVVGQALTAKGSIYTLTLLVGCGLAWFWFTAKGPFQQGWMMAFIWALGMTNHWQTTLLWTPWIVIKFFKTQELRNPKNILLACTLALLGSSVYLFLPLRAIRDCVPSWGYPIHPSLLYWVLSRQLVSQTEHWVQPFGFYRDTAFEFLRFLRSGIFPITGLFSLLGAMDLFRKKRKEFWGLFVWGAPVLIGVLLIHEEQNIYLLPVYLVSLGMWFSLLTWNGLGFMGESLGNGVVGRSLMGLFLVSFLIWDIHVFWSEDKSGYFLAGDFGMNILRDTPRGSILLAEGDPYVMPIWYEQVANGKRPDLIFEPAVFLVHGWGWKQIADRSVELKAKIELSAIFRDRLKSLTALGVSRPLCYSLGHEKLGQALQDLPGGWLQRGLVREWVPEQKKEPLKTSRGRYRIRVSKPWPSDPASSEIFFYYQLAQARLGL